MKKLFYILLIITSLCNIGFAQITGSLNITTDSTEAKVYIDGTYKGNTPLLIDGIIAGTHQVKLVRQGFVPIQMDGIVVYIDSTVSINKHLEQNPNFTYGPKKIEHFSKNVRNAEWTYQYGKVIFKYELSSFQSIVKVFYSYKGQPSMEINTSISGDYDTVYGGTKTIVWVPDSNISNDIQDYTFSVEETPLVNIDFFEDKSNIFNNTNHDMANLFVEFLIGCKSIEYRYLGFSTICIPYRVGAYFSFMSQYTLNSTMYSFGGDIRLSGRDWKFDWQLYGGACFNEVRHFGFDCGMRFAYATKHDLASWSIAIGAMAFEGFVIPCISFSVSSFFLKYR